jgi:hypothetical protein
LQHTRIGGSHTAHPIACVAAIAICAERAGAAANRGTRQLGAIAALDLAVGDAGYPAGISPRLYQHFMVHMVRPIGSTIT